MDTFQYAQVILGFLEGPLSETAIWVKTHDASGKITQTVEKTGDSFIERPFEWEDPNYPMEKMAPVFAKMGAEGWEVIGFKFGSGARSFATALLKRKVQQGG